MKRFLALIFLAAFQSGCTRDEMSIGGTDASQCEVAYDGSNRSQPRSDFLRGCATAPWVAVCMDGSASFSDAAVSICKSGGGVAEWHRVIDG